MPAQQAAEAAEAITRWKPLLLTICGECSQEFNWLHDDFVSDAYLALWKDFTKPTRDLPRVTGALVATIVKRAIWATLRHERRKNPIAFSQKAMNVYGHVCRTRLAACRANLDAPMDAQTIANHIPAKHRSDLVAWLTGTTPGEIGLRHGISHETARLRLKLAFRNLFASGIAER